MEKIIETNKYEPINIKEKLNLLAEEEYKAFSSNLLPGINNIMGVRLPHLRKIAKDISKVDWRQYLKKAQDTYFEEVMLQGMVIGCSTSSIDERLSYIRDFVPKINNWSVCDSFCVGLKFIKDNKEQVWDFIQTYVSSDQEFEVRFALVVLLNYYIDKDYIDSMFEVFDRVNHEGYYARMALAWAISMAYVKMPKETMVYLKNNKLDDFTYNKALQKIRESLKVDKQVKKQISLMKRG